MASRVGFPGGRAKRLGEDADVNSRETELLRAGSMPGTQAICYNNDKYGLGESSLATTMTLAANTLYLSPARPIEETLEASRAGMYVSTVAVDPGIVDVGLYALDRGDRLLTLLPNSTASFEWTAATVGNQRIDMTRALVVKPVDTLYYFAARRRANSVDVWATPFFLGGVDIYPRGYTLPYTERLPGNINLSAAPFITTANLHPVFGYFSNAWSPVL